MDWEWIPLGIMLVLVGSFYVGSLYLAFKQGMEVGKQTGAQVLKQAVRHVPQPQRSESINQFIAQAPQNLKTAMVCRECGYIDGHAKDCRENKPKPDRRRWMGFSRIKAELENKESA